MKDVMWNKTLTFSILIYLIIRLSAIFILRRQTKKYINKE
jgi:hypothetical protein